MDNEFYTLLTDKGMAKIASALADKKQIHLQKMAVGDGSGKYYEPTSSQTQLRHEVWRGDMNTLTVAPDNPNWLIAEVVLPENIGGWYIREVGVFDADGELIAIGKFPESYKPLLPGGCGKQVCIRLIMEVSNTTAVTLTVDPSIVLATRDYVDSQLDEHEHSTNHPDATLTQKGFTQLSNATDSDDETKAATPKAVKAAMAEARNHTHTWNQITGVPDGTLTQKGIVKLNNATNSTSTTEAATPSAVKAAMDKANAAAPASHNHPWNQITGIPDGTLTQKGIVKLNNATNSTSTTEAATPSAVKAAMDKANAAAPANHSHTADQISGIFPKINGDGAFSLATVPFTQTTQGGIRRLNDIMLGEIRSGDSLTSCYFFSKPTHTLDKISNKMGTLPGIWRTCTAARTDITDITDEFTEVNMLVQRIPVGNISRVLNIRNPYANYTTSKGEEYSSINFTCDIDDVGSDILFTASNSDPEEYGRQLFENAANGMYGEIKPHIIPISG
ncbi:phage tail protein [Citrobacter freundii]|nr:phage tail protein [Citrobacter freundii]QLZ61846.1 phage tail protein [Citrobacter freundii]